ncbi:hypothetical protein F383_14056 [Gossypium arboreum]|uniref:Uncharacterized protein n=1 Tax=Gossypium arboreum TaxID=29729 RepID=A0A0B0PYS3_GOSAR|nr:hypothetical protein F383_14056 [Gossypium arboreum]
MIKPLEEYVCTMDLAWTAWTGNADITLRVHDMGNLAWTSNSAMKCEVHGNAYM